MVDHTVISAFWVFSLVIRESSMVEIHFEITNDYFFCIRAYIWPELFSYTIMLYVFEFCLFGWY